MKKGFTMIEMLAVFTLLGILILITLPQITSLLKKGNNESYEEFKNDIYTATEAYIVDKRIMISNGSSINIYLIDVINDGYLKSTLVNPNTNNKIIDETYTRIIVSKDNNGVLSYQLLEADSTTCSISKNETWVFDYTGNVQNFNVPCDGKYKIELWGAQGGNSTAQGGKGSYTVGTIMLNKALNIYLYVGGAGSSTKAGVAQNINGGYNGGGATGGQACCNRIYGSGGGATDIRLVSGEWNNLKSLASRIMVAAGGGGSYSGSNDVVASNAGGSGGALIGKSGTQSGGTNATYCYGLGGTQLAGGKVTTNCYYQANYATLNLSSFGIGGGDTGSRTGGGGGYYGGSSSGHIASAGGGSSYISGYTGSIAIKSESDLSPRTDSHDTVCNTNTTDVVCSYHYSNYIFKDTNMIDGDSSMPNKNGNGNTTGNLGNGYAKITYLGK